MLEIPGVIRESVRDVLGAHGYTIARTQLLAGPPYLAVEALQDGELEDVLREIGNNSTQCLYSIDESFDDSTSPAPPPTHDPAGDAEGERDGTAVVPQTAVPSRSSCTPSVADLLSVGQTLRALAAAGRPTADTSIAIARVGEWLVSLAHREAPEVEAA